MIWGILALLGVPLWLCAAGIIVVIYRNHALRRRPGDVPVRRHLPGKRRWWRGHGVWAHDVFAFRGSPAAWKEDLLVAATVSRRPPRDSEKAKLRRLDNPVIATITDDQGVTVDFAASADEEGALF